MQAKNINSFDLIVIQILFGKSSQQVLQDNVFWVLMGRKLQDNAVSTNRYYNNSFHLVLNWDIPFFYPHTPYEGQPLTQGLSAYFF